MDKERKVVVFCLIVAVFCSPVFTGDWKATVVKNLDALVSSCVVVPCTFTYPGDLPSSKLRGTWHISKDKNQRVYDEDKTRILENFRGRTQMLGHLGQNNCSLEINELKDHDNGPFCFRIELVENDQPTVNKFSFLKDCIHLKMLHDPPKPTLTHSKTATEGDPFTVSCKVIHTCPSHVPELTWSRIDANSRIENHREIHSGIWEAESILTFTPVEKDDHQDVTCTADFYGPKSSSATFTLHVKCAVSYNHIIIPSAVGIGTAVVFTVFCILMVKKYKKRITELQNQEGIVWNRLSRQEPNQEPNHLKMRNEKN